MTGEAKAPSPRSPAGNRPGARIRARSLGLAALLLLAAAPAARAQDPPGVRAVAFSPDGKLLAAGSGEPKEPGTVTLWDAATRSCRWAHAEKAGVPAVTFSPDGQTLAIAV